MFGYSSFGGWLRAERRNGGLTQDQFGKIVFCAAITLRKIENDQLRPSRELADSIAASLGVPNSEREAVVDWARARRGQFIVLPSPNYPVDRVQPHEC